MIVSRANRTIKDIRQLRRCKGDRAILEGPHLVEEALTGGLDLEAVLMTSALAESPAGITLAGRLRRPPLLVSTEVLASCADADGPQGVLAVARLPRKTAPLSPSAGSVALFLDGVQDPGNVGALARVAEAVGASAMMLSPGCAHPNHPRALRASAGSLLRLQVAVEVEPEVAVAATSGGGGVPWIGLDPHAGDDLWCADLAPTFVLALGAEGPGLSPGLGARLHRRIRIPLAAPVESLNVVVAAALVLFELRRRSSVDRAGAESGSAMTGSVHPQ